MILWTVIAVLTALAVLAVLWPLSRRAAGASRARAAVEVYRDQLSEIDLDRSRGLINDREAEAARAEIARRLIAEDARSVDGGEAPSPALRRRRVTAVIGLAGLPLMALGLYAATGSPNLPDQPLAARLAEPLEAQNVDMLISRVERHLAENPDDAQGWDVIGPIYLRLGRNEDAARAFRAAMQLDGAQPDRASGLGEALTNASGGIVTDAAAAAFRRAVELSPDEPRARYYLALAKAQDGDVDGAVADWQSLLEGAPADTPWAEMVRRRIAAAEAGDDMVPQEANP